METPQAITLLRVASSQPSPVAEAAALPRIEQFLTNQRASEAVAANIKQLRAAAKITYMGEFAKTEGSATAPPASAKAAAPAPTSVAPAADSKTAIEKGVAGLK